MLQNNAATCNSGESLKKSKGCVIQGVVTPIGPVVTAATGVKKRSRGQGLFLVSVKRSGTIFKLGRAVKMVAFFMAINIRNGRQLVFSVCGQTVKAPVCDASSGQATKTMVKIF